MKEIFKDKEYWSVILVSMFLHLSYAFLATISGNQVAHLNLYTTYIFFVFPIAANIVLSLAKYEIPVKDKVVFYAFFYFLNLFHAILLIDVPGDVLPYVMHFVFLLANCSMLIGLYKDIENNNKRTENNTQTFSVTMHGELVNKIESISMITGKPFDETYFDIVTRGIWVYDKIDSENTVAVVDKITNEIKESL
jgi:hypothetical protein